ncbi:hypothetical protein, partial [Streptomyces sp. NPDC127098]|uniref:hypothetical protein n=1 Tax=Streptomyces sp. NPDC127098 TaxID=3347137 RepID=UPI0036574B63
MAFEHASDPDRLYLLDEATSPWHGPDHHWGAGFAITSRGSGRWQTPYEIAWRADGAIARHRPVPGLELEVRLQATQGRHRPEHRGSTDPGDVAGRPRVGGGRGRGWARGSVGGLKKKNTPHHKKKRQ